MKLEGLDFEEKKRTNQRKRLIMEGKDPEVEEKERERARQKRIRAIRRDFQKQMKKSGKKKEGQPKSSKSSPSAGATA